MRRQRCWWLYVSDYNLIELMVTQRRCTQGKESCGDWKEQDVNRDLYAKRIMKIDMLIVIFGALTVDDQIFMLNDWIREVNYVLLGRRRNVKPIRVICWIRELSLMRRGLSRLRKRFQRARRASVNDLSKRKAEFLIYVRTYKHELSRSKENNCMRLCSTINNCWVLRTCFLLIIW